MADRVTRNWPIVIISLPSATNRFRTFLPASLRIKPQITKKSHDQIRMVNHGNRKVSHDSGNAALASDNVKMKR